MSNLVLSPPDYTLELWNINGQYIADITPIISTQLKWTQKINDTSTIDASIDLVQFEKLCYDLGIPNPQVALFPNRSEIKVRRNGVYREAASVVKVQANINKSETSKLVINGTGYLNFFKNRYVSATYTNKTYAQMARQLIIDTQNQTNGSFGIVMGTDTASPTQQSNRTMTYDTQEVKENIINRTKLANDNFEFEFTHDKRFNTMPRLGSIKPQITLDYPGNIDTFSATWDGTTQANKVIGFGAGTGNERKQATYSNAASAAEFKIRERVETFSEVSDQATVNAYTQGKLNIYKDIYAEISLDLVPAGIDLALVQLGDVITVNTAASSYTNVINGLYRITELDVVWEKESGVETANATLVKWS